MESIQEKAETVEHLFEQFRLQQTELGGDVTPADKQVLRDKLKALEDELNRYLAGEYGVDPNKASAYQKLAIFAQTVPLVHRVLRDSQGGWV